MEKCHFHFRPHCGLGWTNAGCRRGEAKGPLPSHRHHGSRRWRRKAAPLRGILCCPVMLDTASAAEVSERSLFDYPAL